MTDLIVAFSSSITHATDSGLVGKAKTLCGRTIAHYQRGSGKADCPRCSEKSDYATIRDRYQKEYHEQQGRFAAKQQARRERAKRRIECLPITTEKVVSHLSEICGDNINLEQRNTMATITFEVDGFRFVAKVYA